VKRLPAIVCICLAAVVAAQAAGATRKPKPIGNGVVVIDTNLGYANARAAGTGMVLTSTGEILTNNHVIRGATTITVAVPGSTHRYAATVAGYSVSSDVAVLHLANATNLKAIVAAKARAVIGQKVRALGNAGGTGRLTSAAGHVVGLGKAITANDEDGTNEQLSGLIETDANVRPGDSGGPLLDAAGRVVGMNTAGSNAGAPDSYAVPIGAALAVTRNIERGLASATVHIGDTAFLGVQVQSSADGAAGAVIAAVVPGGPAAAAGLAAGDVITQIGDVTISSPADVGAFMLTQAPGSSVALAYVDQSGVAATTTVVLASGPPQ
jgi:S1-C subfamily serine protease